MKIKLDDIDFNVIITKKRTNKNTYLRVKEDLNIYITTNYFTSEKDLLKLINNHKSDIFKMYMQRIKQQKNKQIFTYLGKKYDIVFYNKKTFIGNEKIFVASEDKLQKWLKEQANNLFLVELEKIYNLFPRSIPYPNLTIRSMKTRWGVCNTKTKRVTLNLELIKKDIKYLDYVIAHELSHLIYPNHSKDFWLLVSQIIPDYKKLRKELNSYE